MTCTFCHSGVCGIVDVLVRSSDGLPCSLGCLPTAAKVRKNRGRKDTFLFWLYLSVSMGLCQTRKQPLRNIREKQMGLWPRPLHPAGFRSCKEEEGTPGFSLWGLCILRAANCFSLYYEFGVLSGKEKTTAEECIVQSNLALTMENPWGTKMMKNYRKSLLIYF